MASKLCDSCKSATATLFCRADSAFLCLACDSKVHAANKLASRHARVWLCEVCEQAPAHVTCKADAAALCLSCDHDIHSVNPLARRHDRVPVTPFYDSSIAPNSLLLKPSAAAINFLDERYFSDVDVDADADAAEEAEAASWLLPNPNPNPKPTETPDLNSDKFEFLPEMDPYLDLDYGHVDPKLEAQDLHNSAADGVVPVQSLGVDLCFGIDFPCPKSLPYGYNSRSISHSVSSSSMEVAVVPDGNAMTEISNPSTESTIPPLQITAADREARVLRYREKRKNRKFEKTIRYASRKAYAETRPRIKGRFAKRTDMEFGVSGYGVVPSL